MTRAAVIEPRAPRSGPTRLNGRAGQHDAEAWERDQLTDRLRSLRRVLPVLAQEMASARRRATHLEIDNRRLVEQVRELRAQLEAHEGE